MSFLDDIDQIVNDTSKKYSKRDYAFLDDAQEVALGEDEIKGGESDEQSGFSGDMDMDEDQQDENSEEREDDMS